MDNKYKSFNEEQSFPNNNALVVFHLDIFFYYSNKEELLRNEYAADIEPYNITEIVSINWLGEWESNEKG